MTKDLIDALKDGLGVLSARDKEFAQSLVKQYGKKGELSDKQWPWVKRLVDKIECFGVPDFTKDEVAVGQFQGVIALFDAAKKHLKYPSIWLTTKGGQEIELAVAGASSKYAGKVKVTDGKPYGQNKWFGTVSPDGAWDPGSQAEPIKDDLTDILAKLADNPVRVAKEFGKLHGRCCFCRSKLTDNKENHSTDVGYGPTCAKNWGLPWGVKQALKLVNC